MKPVGRFMLDSAGNWGCVWFDGKKPNNGELLYTAPREWQYLTDDEIKEIVGSYGNGIGGYTRELFDKIQAKIRDKNG